MEEQEKAYVWAHALYCCHHAVNSLNDALNDLGKGEPLWWNCLESALGSLVAAKCAINDLDEGIATIEVGHAISHTLEALSTHNHKPWFMVREAIYEVNLFRTSLFFLEKPYNLSLSEADRKKVEDNDIPF